MKNLDSYGTYFWVSFYDFFIFENDVNVVSKRNQQNNFEKNT